MTVIETEANRLNALIDATAQIWLDFQRKHPVPWEGAIDSAMAAACSRIEALTAENERLAKAWKNKHAYQVREAKSHSEYFDKSQRRMHELTAENERLREALVATEGAISEYYRYWTGGEMRGSYDGKPERAGLWKAQQRARAALEAKP
jgi:hypothetical protein